MMPQPPRGMAAIPQPQSQPVDAQALAQMLMSGGPPQGAVPGMPTPDSVPMPQPPGMSPQMGGPAQGLPPGAQQVGGPMTPQQGDMQNAMANAIGQPSPPTQMAPQPPVRFVDPSQGPVPLYGGQGAPMGPPGMRRF